MMRNRALRWLVLAALAVALIVFSLTRPDRPEQFEAVDNAAEQADTTIGPADDSSTTEAPAGNSSTTTTAPAHVVDQDELVQHVLACERAYFSRLQGESAHDREDKLIACGASQALIDSITLEPWTGPYLRIAEVNGYAEAAVSEENVEIVIIEAGGIAKAVAEVTVNLYNSEGELMEELIAPPHETLWVLIDGTWTLDSNEPAD